MVVSAGMRFTGGRRARSCSAVGTRFDGKIRWFDQRTCSTRLRPWFKTMAESHDDRIVRLVPAPFTRDDPSILREWPSLLGEQNGQKMTVEQIKVIAVDTFPNSVRRQRQHGALVAWISAMLSILPRIVLVAGGSFFTTKPNPSDIDVLSLLPAMSINSLSDEQIVELGRLVDRPFARSEYLLDLYIARSTDSDRIDDFRQLFLGRQNSNEPHGYVIIEAER